MKKKLLNILTIALVLSFSSAYAGTDGNESLSKSSSNEPTKECFEKTSRAIFKFNQGLDKSLFKPIAKGYLKLPKPVKKASGNFVNNLSKAQVESYFPLIIRKILCLILFVKTCV